MYKGNVIIYYIIFIYILIYIGLLLSYEKEILFAARWMTLEDTIHCFLFSYLVDFS